jgi:alpha-D-ribose 1-methylphosphonate 5-triphosphate synthase subunit PhnG
MLSLLSRSSGSLITTSVDPLTPPHPEVLRTFIEGVAQVRERVSAGQAQASTTPTEEDRSDD